MFITEAFKPEYSGQGRQVEKYIPILLDQGYKVTVLTPLRKKGIIKKERILNNRVLIKRIPFYKRHSRIWQLSLAIQIVFYLLIWYKKYDIVHFHRLHYANLFIPFICKLLKKNNIFTSVLPNYDIGFLNDNLGGKLVLFRKISKRYLSYATGVSLSCVNQIISLGYPENKTKFIPVGVDIKSYSPIDKYQKLLLRKELKLNNEKYLLIFSGNLIERKGCRELIEIFDNIVQHRDDVCLIIMGGISSEDSSSISDYFAKNIINEIKERKLNDVIKFTGRLKDDVDIIKYLQISDLFIFPTYFEGTPNALLEAMACGLACVTTSIPGSTDEIIIDDENGLLIDGHASEQGFAPDVKMFVNKTLDLLSNSKKLTRIGKEARKTTIYKYELNNIVEQYISIYQ